MGTLRQLRRVVISAEDAKGLLATFNEAGAHRPGDAPDILLRPWSGGARRRSRREDAHRFT